MTMKMLMIAALALVPSLQDGSQTAESREVEQVVVTAVNKVVKVLRNEDLNSVEKREKSMAIVEPLIDFKLLGMLSLGKTQWSRASPEQRDEFVGLFSKTLKRSYFEKLQLFTDEDVEFEKPALSSSKGSPKYSMVSFIVSKGERIQVGYQLTRRDDGWKVFDFEIEGVSIRKSYGSQYNDYLRENSFDELLTTMRGKIEESKKKDAESDSEESDNAE